MPLFGAVIMIFLKRHSLLIFIIAISILLAILSENTIELFQYKRSLIIDCELWRIITGHFVHNGWEHLWLNILALIIIYLLIFPYVNIQILWTSFIVSCLGISLFLFMFMDELEWYVGLSGVLHSLLTLGSIAAIINGRKEFFILLFFIFAKVIFEQFYGSLSQNFTEIEGTIIVNAHLYGVIIGLCISPILWLKKN